MTSLREIRKRLHSIQSTQQLTKAMEMVAASQLYRAQIKAKHTSFYAQQLENIKNRLSFTENPSPLMVNRNEKNKIGLIVIAADMGLCGSYNSDIYRAAEKFLTKYPQDQVELIPIGRKAVDHYQRRPWKIRHHLHELKQATKSEEIEKLNQQLIDWFLSGELDEIWCVYAHYINLITHTIVTEKFLNIGNSAPDAAISPVDYLLEPSAQEVYKDVLRRYCASKVQSFVCDAHCSELSARVCAMKTATKNADEMVVKLTLQRNKVRQAEITKEMLEITSGAEGLK